METVWSTQQSFNKLVDSSVEDKLSQLDDLGYGDMLDDVDQSEYDQILADANNLRQDDLEDFEYNIAPFIASQVRDGLVLNDNFDLVNPQDLIINVGNAEITTDLDTGGTLYFKEEGRKEFPILGFDEDDETFLNQLDRLGILESLHRLYPEKDYLEFDDTYYFGDMIPMNWGLLEEVLTRPTTKKLMGESVNEAVSIKNPKSLARELKEIRAIVEDEGKGALTDLPFTSFDNDPISIEMQYPEFFRIVKGFFEEMDREKTDPHFTNDELDALWDESLDDHAWDSIMRACDSLLTGKWKSVQFKDAYKVGYKSALDDKQILADRERQEAEFNAEFGESLNEEYLDEVILQLDRYGTSAYEVGGHKLEDEYGYYQGDVILEDDESQAKLKEFGIEPGDKFRAAVNDDEENTITILGLVSKGITAHYASEHKKAPLELHLPLKDRCKDSYYGYITIEHPELGEFTISAGIDGDIRIDGKPWEFLQSKEEKLNQEQIDFVKKHKSELADMSDNDIPFSVLKESVDEKVDPELKAGKPVKVDKWEYQADPKVIKKAINILYDKLSEEEFDEFSDKAMDAYIDKDPDAMNYVKKLFKKLGLPMWVLKAFVEAWDDDYDESLTEETGVIKKGDEDDPDRYHNASWYIGGRNNFEVSTDDLGGDLRYTASRWSHNYKNIQEIEDDIKNLQELIKIVSELEKKGFKNSELRESLTEDAAEELAMQGLKEKIADDFLLTRLEGVDDNYANEVASKFPEYNIEWCNEEADSWDSQVIATTKRKLARAVADELFKYAPRELPIIGESLNEQVEIHMTGTYDDADLLDAYDAKTGKTHDDLQFIKNLGDNKYLYKDDEGIEFIVTDEGRVDESLTEENDNKYYVFGMGWEGEEDE